MAAALRGNCAHPDTFARRELEGNRIMNWWKRRSEQLNAEIQEHIEIETQQNISAGMSPGDARHAALRKFGSVTLSQGRFA